MFTHSADFHLAHKCLEGDEAAVAQLVESYGETVCNFLINAGAMKEEAHEIVDQLWADCVAAVQGRAAGFSRYDGRSALQTWLNAVALNRLLSRKRTEERWSRLVPARLEFASSVREECEPKTFAVADEPDEAPLLELMREAIESAFQNCPPEHFVLLQLVHCDRLRLAEVASMFGCSTATASRLLDHASREVAKATLAHVRATDPWLELKWEDFVTLCGTASPACFGLEA